MPAHATMLSPQQLLDAAKAPFLAYGRKDWDAVKACLTPDFTYDEVATGRHAQGADKAIGIWRGWATALPDSAPTFHTAHLVSNKTVVLEITWKGTHTGPLETPKGPIAATGKRIELRACNVVEIVPETGKTKLQRQYFDMGTILQQLGVAG